MAKKKPYRFVLYLFARAFAGSLYFIPRSWLLSLARGIGSLAYTFVTRQRDRALTHLRLAFGEEKSEKEIRSLARRVFQHLAITAVDVLRFPKLTLEKLTQFVDASNAYKVYDELLKEGKGLISVTAHIGNWELLAGVMTLRGFQGAVLGRRIYYEPYNRWIVNLRLALNVRTIYRDEFGREIFRVLKNNEIIGILPDQDIDSLPGIFVDFFGRPAYTPVAPVKLALATGTPILPNFLIHKPGGKYELIVGDVIHPKVKTSREEAVVEYTVAWMKCFEKIIRQYPDQWAWMHNRWKTRPNEKDKILNDRENENSDFEMKVF